MPFNNSLDFGVQKRPQQRNRNNFNHESNGHRRNCGKKCTPNHRQVFMATGRKCNHCGLVNHFGKICRKNKNTNKKLTQDNRVYNIENYKYTDNSEQQNGNFIIYIEQYGLTLWLI